MSEGKKIGVNSIIYGGIFLALTEIVLFLAGVIPGAELTFYAFSTLFIMIMVEETSLKNGWILFIASCILALLLLPNKFVVLPYGGFFGLYGTVKYHIETIRKRFLEYTLKIVFVCIALLLSLYFFNEILFDVSIVQEYPLLLLLTALLMIFLLYDRLLTLLLNYYRKRFSGFLKIG